MKIKKVYKFENDDILSENHNFYHCATDEGPCFLYQKGGLKGPKIVFQSHERAIQDLKRNFTTLDERIETIAKIAEFALVTPFLEDPKDITPGATSHLNPFQKKAGFMIKFFDAAFDFERSLSATSPKARLALVKLLKLNKAFLYLYSSPKYASLDNSEKTKHFNDLLKHT